MIDEILISLKEYLSCMMLRLMGRHINVVLNSVNRDKEAESKDHLVITLLRIEEETSRKPQQFYAVKNEALHRKSPDIDINLEILISSPFSPYETALQLISNAIIAMNSIKTVDMPDGMTDDSFQRVKSVNMSLMGLSFDQTLSMWQTLGGTLVPSMAYRIRTLTVEGALKSSDVKLVEKVELQPGLIDPQTKQTKLTALPLDSEEKFAESEQAPAPPVKTETETVETESPKPNQKTKGKASSKSSSKPKQK